MERSVSPIFGGWNEASLDNWKVVDKQVLQEELKMDSEGREWGMPYYGFHVKEEYDIRVKEEPGIRVKEESGIHVKEIAVEADF